jgi:hypothetical protein
MFIYASFIKHLLSLTKSKQNICVMHMLIYGAYIFFAPVSQLLLHFLCSVSEIFKFQLVYWLFWYDFKHTVWTHTLGCLIIFVNFLILEYQSYGET